jgi:hypothetical protein
MCAPLNLDAPNKPIDKPARIVVSVSAVANVDTVPVSAVANVDTVPVSGSLWFPRYRSWTLYTIGGVKLGDNSTIALSVHRSLWPPWDCSWSLPNFASGFTL